MAITEKSEKFWCGVNDKVTMGSTGEWSMRKNEGVKELGGVWRSMDDGGIGKFFVVWGVGTSMGGIWKE